MESLGESLDGESPIEGDEKVPAGLLELYPGGYLDVDTGTVFDTESHEILLGSSQLNEGIVKTYLSFLHLFPDLSALGPALLSMYAEAATFDALPNEEQRYIAQQAPYLEHPPYRRIICKFLEYQLLLWGLASPQAVSFAKRGVFSPEIYLSQDVKFYRFEELVEKCNMWAADKLRIGLVHGAFDPPTKGHVRLMSLMKGNTVGVLPDESGYPACDRLIAAISPNDLVMAKKSSPGDPRPRFPQIYGRLRMLLTYPWADAGMITPLDLKGGAPVEQQFAAIYKELNITVIGTSRGHRLVPQYQRIMQELWGDRGMVHTWDDEEARLSSTALMEKLEMETGNLNSVEVLSRALNHHDTAARKEWRI